MTINYNDFLNRISESSFNYVNMISRFNSPTTLSGFLPFVGKDMGEIFHDEMQNGVFDNLLTQLDLLSSFGNKVFINGRELDIGSFFGGNTNNGIYSEENGFDSAAFLSQSSLDINDVAFLHFSRNILNDYTLEYSDIVISGYDEYTWFERAKAVFHIYNDFEFTNNEGNFKVTRILEDGSSEEYIFRYHNGEFSLVVDPRNAGSFNFIDATESSLGHNALDIAPFTIFGNDVDDPSTVLQRDLIVDRLFLGESADLPNLLNTATITRTDQSDEIVLGGIRYHVFANGGDDTIFSGMQHDTIDGGDGIDTVDYSRSAEGVAVNLNFGFAHGGDASRDDGPDEHEVLISVENVVGSAGGDIIVGSHDDNALSGAAGDDRLYGLEADDTLSGGAGSDYLNGGDGDDTAVYLGNEAQYAVNRIDNDTVIVTTISGTELGRDTLDSIETIEFADGTLSFQVPRATVSLEMSYVLDEAHSQYAFFSGYIETFQTETGDIVVGWETSDGHLNLSSLSGGSSLITEVEMVTEADTVSTSAFYGFADFGPGSAAILTDGALSGSVLVTTFDEISDTIGATPFINFGFSFFTSNYEFYGTDSGNLVITSSGNSQFDFVVNYVDFDPISDTADQVSLSFNYVQPDEPELSEGRVSGWTSVLPDGDLFNIFAALEDGQIRARVISVDAAEQSASSDGVVIQNVGGAPLFLAFVDLENGDAGYLWQDTANDTLNYGTFDPETGVFGSNTVVVTGIAAEIGQGNAQLTQHPDGSISVIWIDYNTSVHAAVIGEGVPLTLGAATLDTVSPRHWDRFDYGVVEISGTHLAYWTEDNPTTGDHDLVGQILDPNNEIPSSDQSFIIAQDVFDGYEVQVTDEGQLMVIRTVEGSTSSAPDQLVAQIFDIQDALSGHTEIGSTGSDTIYGGDGNDTITGGAQADLLFGGGGRDVISGGPDTASDTINGGDGADRIGGGLGHDLLSGGNDNDIISGGDGRDTVYGEEGSDTLAGGSGNDSVLGGNDRDLLIGGLGQDTLHGGDGDDRINGNGNLDGLFGEAGNDVLAGGLGGDVVSGGIGDDTIRGNDGNDSVSGGSGDDDIFGDTGNDFMSGGSGADLLIGGIGNDTLSGGTGNDVLNSGGDDDALSGGANNDRFVFVGNFGHDEILDFEEGFDTVVLGGINPQQVTTTTAGEDLVLQVSGGNSITIVNGFSDNFDVGSDVLFL